jgi:hypothetical protein
MCAQVGFCNVEHCVPSVEAFGREHFVVLGQSQSRETFSQVAHVGGRWRVGGVEWCNDQMPNSAGQRGIRYVLDGRSTSGNGVGSNVIDRT